MATRYKLATQDRVESFSNKTIDGVTPTVMGYVDPTSSIQTQLNGKQATLTNPITGTGTTNEISYWTAAGTQGTLAVATYPSLTELSYVKGATSAIQTQISAKAPTASPTFTGNVTIPAGSHPLNGYFNLASPASDHTCTGTATNAFQSGATIALMNLVYMGSSSKWLITDSDAIATSGGLIGIAMEAKNDTQAMLVALPGTFVRDDSWSWTIGATLYAGETAGAIQATIPTGADGVIRVIGFAVSATVVFFNPSSDNSTVVA